MPGTLIVAVVLAVFAMIMISKIIRVVPQQQAWVVERLGKYSGTLDAGLHILMPFLDVVRYKHSLKEIALDVPEQICITKDNVQVGVDGVLYFKILNPERASYGISRLLVRHPAAGADEPAQRDRQDRSRPYVRRADEHQPLGRRPKWTRPRNRGA